MSAASLTRLLVCALLMAAPSTAAAWELDLDLGLYNRFNLLENQVERLLRYDPDSDAFDAASYLTPTNDRIYYSLVVRAALEVEATSWLGFGLQVDTGELQPVGQWPATAEISLASVPDLVSQTVGPLPVYSTANSEGVTSNGQPIADEAEETLFIRQVFVSLTAPETAWLTARIGRIAARAGRGLIYDDYGLGAELQFDLDRLRGTPLRGEVLVLLPTRAWDTGLRSPLVSFRLDYIFSSFLTMVEYVGLVGAFFHDGDDNFAQLLQPTFSEVSVHYEGALAADRQRDLTALGMSAAMPSKANIGWVGVQGEKLLGDFSVGGALIFEVGTVKLDNPLSQLPAGFLAQNIPLVTDETITLSTFGVALDLSAGYLITEDLAVGLFFLFLSGEENAWLSGTAGEGRYGSFLGVVPHLTHTNLFFSGGMNETFSGRQASTSGINGRGVIAFGPNLTWEINEQVGVGAGAALLFAPVASQEGGHFYGFELDLQGGYRPLEWLAVSVEYDLLVAENFFSSKGVAHKLLVGLDLTYNLVVD